MTKGRFPEFEIGEEFTYPTYSDFVDFTKVGGVDVYHFVSSNDGDCTPQQANFLAENIPTYVETKEYGCYSSHEWFNGRGDG